MVNVISKVFKVFIITSIGSFNLIKSLAMLSLKSQIKNICP